MKWHHLFFLCVTVMSAAVPGCRRNEGQVRFYTPDPTLPRLEHDFSQVQREIKETQEKVRSLLTKMVAEIEEGDIDAARAASNVEQTTEQIKHLKARIQKLRGVKPEDVERPLI